MNRVKAAIILSVLIATGLSSAFFSSCRRKSRDGMIIFTQVTGMKHDNTDRLGNTWQNSSPVLIVALDPDKPGSEPEVLTKDYFSARSPEVSYDGASLLFTAQKKQNDTWQIYEMNLADSKIRQITSSPDNCVDPAWLPNGRIIFSKLPVIDTLNTGHSIFSCDLTGSDIRQITFNPHAYSYSTVLRDGRILTVSSQLYPEKKDPVFMALRPDGTKAELFYKSSESDKLSGRGWETTNGKIVFVESDKDNQKRGNVISINYNRPLHSRVNLTSEIKGDFQTVFPLVSGRLLVSYRESESDKYALYEFDPEQKILGKPVYISKDFDILEAIAIEKHERPKRLPSEVDMGVKTGLILCQDINVIGSQFPANSSGIQKAHKIQVIGRDSTLGIVNVEEDGSFYLKVIADTPFKIQTVDEQGRIMNGPGAWIWLRPNERRGCVGCHEDPELVPGNKVPLSVKNPPVNIPVHISKVAEKKISLE
jgi:hypothetical protein